MKTYSFENVYTWGQKHPDQFVMTVQDENDSAPQITTIRSHNELEMRDIVNLWNLAPEGLRNRARQMTSEQTFGKKSDGKAA